MTKFAQPWSMDCSYEQALEVKPLLEEMGYDVRKFSPPDTVCLLASNWLDKLQVVSNLKERCKNNENRLYLGSFHRDLLLAIAAMRTDGWHKWEAVVCLANSEDGYFTKRYLYRVLCRYEDNRILLEKDNEETPNGWLIKKFRKATTQEIIDYFRNDKRVFDVEGRAKEKAKDTVHCESHADVKLVELSVEIGSNSYTFSQKGIQVNNYDEHHSVESLEAAIRQYRKHFNP